VVINCDLSGTNAAHKQTGYLNGPCYKVPDVKNSSFGGKSSPDVKNNVSKSFPVDYIVIDSFSDAFYRAVSIIYLKPVIFAHSISRIEQYTIKVKVRAVI
jgi:hypothetical protein